MNDYRISDDGERFSLGLEPISDDTTTPAQRARAIAECSGRVTQAWPTRCGTRSPWADRGLPQVRQQALFFQFAHGLLLADLEEGFTRARAVEIHYWDCALARSRGRSLTCPPHP